MVSPLTVMVAAVFGLMLYVAIPIAAMSAPVDVRKRVGTFYLKLGTRSLKQFTFVRRVLSGYDILPISVDDEQKLLKVSLSSSMVGDDNEYRFNDPDNRIKRLFKKPVALNYEMIPAAVDAELSELGHWLAEKRQNEGIISGNYLENPDDVEVDPYVETSDELRLVDPIDTFELVLNDVDAENIKTTEELTKERHSKYNSGAGIKDTVRIMMAFATGALGVIGIKFIDEEYIGGSGGGDINAPVVGNETLMASVDPGVVMDMVVTVL